MMKHAYLIMAHNDFSLLKKLIEMLDYNNNDLYLHIDKKVDESTFNSLKSELIELVKNAKLYFSSRINITWGSYSQIEAEIVLLKQSTITHHDYYHLISGSDLPIKSNSEIDSYFEDHQGKEFISFDEKACENKSFYYRMNYYYFDTLRKLRLPILSNLDNLFMHIQKFIGINRINKNYPTLMKGANWFDITESFAKYALDVFPRYHYIFKHSICADEIFLQTIAFNSPFKEYAFKKEIRFIDWKDQINHPNIITMKYYDDLMNSDCLFARKFSTSIDSQIINEIYNKYKQQGS